MTVRPDNSDHYPEIEDGGPAGGPPGKPRRNGPDTKSDAAGKGLESPAVPLYGSRCSVPWCEAEVVVWTEIQATADTGLIVVTVPFCREHGPRVGGDV